MISKYTLMKVFGFVSLYSRRYPLVLSAFLSPKHHVFKTGVSFSSSFHKSNADSVRTKLYSSSTYEESKHLSMENLYMEWSVEDDRILVEHMNEDIPTLAAKLGRGLRGVEERKKKLNNVHSSAYQRLFNTNAVKSKKDALTPAKEVLLRIKWDHSLDESLFTVGYFDRMQQKVIDVAFDAKNESVQGKEPQFVFAIPEHRIYTIRYKERIIWEKSKRLDLMFGSMNGNGETIDNVILTYDTWKEEQDEMKEYNRKRQAEVAVHVKNILGDVLFASLKDMSAGLQEKAQILDIVPTVEVEEYVYQALKMFQSARRNQQAQQNNQPHAWNQDGMSQQSDVEDLELFSNLVALLPDDTLREQILTVIYKQIVKLDPSRFMDIPSANRSDNLPVLNEDDLMETFVRGSGAGGQKINKTANKVVLVHIPTNVRVECQDTRSLQQNRKIARKRLGMKLDEIWNGSESKIQQKISKKIDKKQKQKARNQSRLRKKLEAKNKFKENGGENVAT